MDAGLFFKKAQQKKNYTCNINILRPYPPAFYLILFVLFCFGFTIDPGKKLFDNQEYASAEKFFKKLLIENPKSPEANYYLGRALLAQDRASQALTHIQKAVSLRPENAKYHFWLGVTNWGIMEFEKEREGYLKALEINPSYIPAMIYLGHNYLDAGKWEQALRYYEKVVEMEEFIPEVLFNRALLYKKLKQKNREKGAWKEFLSEYQDGMWAVRSAEYLNDAGDFSYRIHLLGARKIVLKTLAFNEAGAEPDRSSLESLNKVGNILKNNRQLTIHIAVYKDNNSGLARKRSKWIKNYFMKRFQIASHRLKTSWFGTFEEIKIKQKKFELSESVRFITDTEVNE